MEVPTTCALCGDPSEPGQAWMESERDGSIVAAHAGCLYREGKAADEGWTAQDTARR